MDVTRENLEEAYVEFSTHAAKARYCAIDLEMTGIHMPGTKLTTVDTPEQRYFKMRQVASKFGIIQIGFCLIETESYEVSDVDSFVLRPYNCYVFPKSNYNGGGPIITMETSAVEFNTSHNMDWNKWIREGIPYVNKSVEETLVKKALKERDDDKNTDSAIREFTVKKDDDIAFIAAESEKIRVWFKRALAQLQPGYVAPVPTNTEATDDDTSVVETVSLEYNIPSCNSFLRGALISAVSRELKYVPASTSDADNAAAAVTDEDDDDVGDYKINKTDVCTYPSEVEYILRSEVRGFGWNSTGHLLLMTPELLQAHIEAREVKRQQELNAKLGIRRFWRTLIDNNVGFVGHNCYYDILFLYHYLHDSLPETFDEFRNSLHEIFPSYFDTKLMYDSDEFKKCVGYVPSPKTHLNCLFDSFKASMVKPQVCEDEEKNLTDSDDVQTTEAVTNAIVEYRGPRVIVCADGYNGYNTDSNKFHEAGFDAYCTAYVFTHIMSIIRSNDDQWRADSYVPCSPKLDAYNAHTYSLFSFYATNLNPHTSIDQFRRLVSGNVYVLQGFEPTTNNQDITGFFKVDVNQLKWVNDTIVAITQVEDKDVEALTSTAKTHPTWKLLVLDEFMKEQMANPVPVSSAAPIKRKFKADADEAETDVSKKQKTSFFSSWTVPVLLTAACTLAYGFFAKRK